MSSSFLRAGLPGTSAPPWWWPLSRAANWLQLQFRTLARGRIHVRSAFLALWCLEAVVPLAVLAAAISRWAGVSERLAAGITQVLEQSILGLTADQVTRILQPLLVDASVGALGGIGVASALFLGLQLYLVVEYDYNDLLGARASDRPAWLRALLFPAFLAWATVLLGGGLVATGAILQLDTWWLLLPGPLLLTVATLALALQLFPSRPLPHRATLTGAVVGAVWFELVKTVFYVQTTYVPQTLEAIYHYLAFIPVAFFWMHLTWFSVLLSVTVAHATEHRRALWKEQADRVEGHAPLPRHPDGWFALAVLQQLLEAGEEGVVQVDLAAALGAPPSPVRDSLAFLVEVELAEAVGPRCYRACPGAEEIEVGALLARWRSLVTPPVGESVAAPAPDQSVGATLSRAREAGRS